MEGQILDPSIVTFRCKYEFMRAGLRGQSLHDGEGSRTGGGDQEGGIEIMQQVTSRDGTAIAYERMGQGPPLILVGGALNDHRAAASGLPLAQLLAPNFTVYSYDRRGRGSSGDTKPYAVEREIEDMGALIENAGGSAYAFGMSSGGALALQAAGSGLVITRLAMYEPPFVGGGQGNEYTARLKELIAEERRGDAVALFMRTIGLPGPLIAELRLTPSWAELERLAPTLVYDAIVMGEGKMPPAVQLAKVTIPTLVLTGTTPQMGEATHALVTSLPNARHQVLDGQTHDVAPSALAPALTTFFNEP
jgi:pimeloyl-ACP methyl ester carboxylesterase